MGGLGNQMFQYACGRALALRENRKLYLDARRFYRDKRYKRTFALGKFNIQYDKIIGRNKNLLHKVSEKIENAWNRKKTIHEHAIYWDPQ